MGGQDPNLPFTPFQIYYWNDKPTEESQMVPGQLFSGFLPQLQLEGVFQMDCALRFLSDDAKVMIHGTLCQDVKKSKNQRFRSTKIAPLSFWLEISSIPCRLKGLPARTQLLP